MKTKLTIFFLIGLILLLSTGTSIAMDPVTEDSWIGAYFLKQDTLTQNEKKYPFLDIRQANINQNDLSSNFKLIISNGILADQLKTYQLMKQRNIDLDELYKLDYLIENYNDNPEQLKIELAIMDKLKNEIIRTFENNIKNRNKDYYYNFYHIFLYKTEYFTTPDMQQNMSNRSFRNKFNTSDNELKESVINTKYFNDLVPLKAEEVLTFKDSPLVTVNSHSISKEDREKVLKDLPNAEFKNKYRVSIRQFPLTFQNIEDLYLELIKMNKDDSDILKEVKNSNYYKMSVRNLFSKLQEVI